VTAARHAPVPLTPAMAARVRDAFPPEEAEAIIAAAAGRPDTPAGPGRASGRHAAARTLEDTRAR
jgi:hypothetical protein